MSNRKKIQQEIPQKAENGGNAIKIAMKNSTVSNVELFRRRAKTRSKYDYHKFLKDDADLSDCPSWLRELALEYLNISELAFKAKDILSNLDNKEILKSLKLQTSV